MLKQFKLLVTAVFYYILFILNCIGVQGNEAQNDYQKQPDFRERCMKGKRSMVIEHYALQKLFSFE
jgi:hypothetical protein